MKNVTYEVPNISCGHCVHTIQTELSELDGVAQVVASQSDRKVTVAFDDPASEERIVALLQEINYPPSLS
ncbi:MAG: copper chaperone [Anaerolineales bacterium]|nr:MAG: copper chaperone [Anaerolineales bacterium]